MSKKILELKKQLERQIENCPHEAGTVCGCNRITCSEPNCRAFPYLHTIASHFYKAHPNITAEFKLSPSLLGSCVFQCYNCKKEFKEIPYYLTGRWELGEEFCQSCATEFKRLRELHQPKNMSKLKKTKKASSALKKIALPKVQRTPSKSPRSKTSSIDYYNCLMNYAQQGFYDEQENQKIKIHSCCKKCKLSAPSLNSERKKEVMKLVNSYKQVGESLTKLLKPLK